MSEQRKVQGCATCPFAYLSDDCLPTCVLAGDEGIGANQSEPYKRVQYTFRDDAPEWCPLRKGPITVELAEEAP